MDAAAAGKIAYILCEKDAAVPAFIQEKIIAGSGVEWKVERLESGHCPMISCPEKLAGLLVDLVGGLQ